MANSITVTTATILTCSPDGYSTASAARRAAKRMLDGAEFEIIERKNRFFWSAKVVSLPVEPPKAAEHRPKPTTTPLNGAHRPLGPPGPKDQVIVDMALRPEGVTGKEIASRLGWQSASARIDLMRIAERRNYIVEPVPNSKAYRLRVKPTSEASGDDSEPSEDANVVPFAA